MQDHKAMLASPPILTHGMVHKNMPRYLLCSLIAVFICSGCGGGSGGNSFTPANVQGQYEAVAQSTSSPTSVALIESNFTQTGTNFFAGKQSVVILQGTTSSTGFTLTGVGGECDNGILGNDSIQGTFSSATAANLSVTEAGSLGTLTATVTVTFSADGSQITSGTYNVPAACGSASAAGTVSGTAIKPFSGQYAGMLANGTGTTDAVIVTVSQSGLNLTVSGTDNGTSFTLMGSVVGATFDVSGTIAGQAIDLVGIYEHTSNSFLVFDANFNFLGTLNAGTNPAIATGIGFRKPNY